MAPRIVRIILQYFARHHTFLKFSDEDMLILTLVLCVE
jgi:hypothetical protein